MTWAAVLATGRGEVSFRVLVERCPESWVTHPSMVDAATTPPRRFGLSLAGSKMKHVSNPVSGDNDVSSMAVKVVDKDGLATASFAQSPTLTTWLTAEFAAADVTATVRSTTGWPTSGYFWVDSEAVKYTGTSPTTFTGCSRGQYSTIAQKHYITTGSLLRYPQVTNRPVTMAGARAYVYAYGQNDDPVGAGTLVWQGLVSRDPSHSGAAWSFSIEPMTAALDRSVNSDIAEPVHPRGISYNAWRPFGLAFSDGPGNVYPIMFPVVAGDTGFFASNADFVDYLNTKIVACGVIAATGTTVWAVADGEQSWHLECLSSALSNEVFVVESFSLPGHSVDPIFNGEPTPDPRPPSTTNIPVSTFAATAHYYWMPLATSLPGAGSVPRGYFGRVFRGDPAAPAVLGTYPPERLYLGGAIDATGLTGAAIEWKNLGPWTQTDALVDIFASSAVNRSIDCGRAAIAAPEDMFHGFTSAALPEIRLGRRFLEEGNLGDFLSAVVALNADGINAGSVPSLRTDDFETLPAIFPAVLDRVVNSRTYFSFGEVNLAEIVKAECLLAGYGLGLTDAGKIRFYELVPPVYDGLASLSDAFTGERTIIDAALVSDGLASFEPLSRGLANQVAVMRGYDSVEDDYTERPVIVRDVAAFGQSPRPRTITIEPKSSMFGGVETYPEIVSRAQKLFSLFAYPYANVRVDCDLRYFSRRHGHTIYLTSSHIPDVVTGTMGVTLLPMLVTGREVEISAGKVTLYGYATQSNVAGYVPEFFIATESNVSGNTWTLNLTVGSYSAKQFFAVGYRVRVWRWDSTTAGVVTGIVDSVTDDDTIVVTFAASAAALTADTWVVGWATGADTLATDQTKSAYLAGSDGLVDIGATDIAAKVFG